MASRLRECRKCHKDVPLTASACPSCGTKWGPPTWVKGVAFGAVAVFGLLFLVAVFGPKPKKDDASTPAEPAKSPAAAKPSVADGPVAADIKLPQLFADYAANGVAADAKYRDKIVRVTGLVDRVGKDSFDKPYIHFQLGRDGYRAMFSSEAGLADLKRSDLAAIRCRCENELGAPRLRECVFERVVIDPVLGPAPERK